MRRNNGCLFHLPIGYCADQIVYTVSVLRLLDGLAKKESARHVGHSGIYV